METLKCLRKRQSRFDPEDFVELSVKMLKSSEGIVPELKSKSYVWEVN